MEINLISMLMKTNFFHTKKKKKRRVAPSKFYSILLFSFLFLIEDMILSFNATAGL